MTTQTEGAGASERRISVEVTQAEMEMLTMLRERDAKPLTEKECRFLCICRAYESEQNAWTCAPNQLPRAGELADDPFGSP